MIIDRSIYLGGASDPQPVFRDASPEGAPDGHGSRRRWPEGAVFCVTFRREHFQGLPDTTAAELPMTEFFGTDGWPLDLPPERRALSRLVKKEFQVFPWGWRTWRSGWRRAALRPETLAAARTEFAAARVLVTASARIMGGTCAC